MKLLLDQGLARSTVQHLAAAGMVAEHVGDLGLADASDETVLEVARQRGSVVATLDADFHRLLALTGAAAPSVIRIRVEGLKGPAAAVLLMRVVSSIGDELAAGAVATVNERRIRVRSLPIIRYVS